MPEVRIGELRLYYEAEGDGHGVILLHELGGSTETWSGLRPRLVGAGFRVVALDLRGAGRSDIPASPYALPDLADDVLRLMNALVSPKPFLLAWLLGGCWPFNWPQSVPIGCQVWCCWILHWSFLRPLLPMLGAELKPFCEKV